MSGEHEHEHEHEREGAHHHGDGVWHDHASFPGEQWRDDPAVSMSDEQLHQVTASGSGGVPVVPVYVLAQRPPNERAAYLRDRRGAARVAGLPADYIDEVERQLAAMDRRVLDPLTSWVCAVVENWRARHAAELALLPVETVVALTARAAIGFVFGFGVMSPVNVMQGDFEADWELCVPPHLWPNVALAVQAQHI